MPTRRSHYAGTVDSNGYAYCVNCGQKLEAHRDTRRALVCPCAHLNVSRPTFEHRFYRCRDCDSDLYQ